MADITIKGLSLWQPWASLMSIGAKKIETRHWFTNYRGWIVIHAAKKWDMEIIETAASPPFAEALKAAEMDPKKLPLGCFVALGRLHRVLSTDSHKEAIPACDSNEYAFGNYDAGRFMWVFDEIWRLKEPVYARGHRRLWTLDEAQRDVVIAMLPEEVREREFGW